MNADALDIADLARLLHAERSARHLSTEALVARLDLAARFQPHRSSYHAALRQAALAERLLPAVSAPPVLLVCESAPFEPRPDRLHDQILLRLLVGLERAGLPGWVLRIPQMRPRAVNWQLLSLPDRPRAIISVGLSNPACLAALRSIAPVIRFGRRSTSIDSIACVEHDAQQEARQIAMYAAANRIEQIAFVAPLPSLAGKRRIVPDDLAVLRSLSAQAQNHYVFVPPHLTHWSEEDKSLREASVLDTLARYAASSILVVVAGPSWASELARACGCRGACHLLCRHWSSGLDAIPTIGPVPDRLAEVLLRRALGEDPLPAEAAVLVPPAWHSRPQ